jgi:hypothetical protein
MAINFNTAPYYDDFNADDKFLQILFNPGRAVQARELTQIQSILQNQLSSGANHIFKNGSPTVGAELSLNIRNYIKLASADASWNGRYVYGVESLAIAQIVQLHDDETQPIYYIKPLSGKFADSEQIDTYDTVCNGGFDPEDPTVCQDNSFYNATLTYKTGTLVGSGKGMEATINNGIYYVSGHFVPVLAQTIFLDYTNDTPTHDVGLDIEETIIEATVDPRLLDPASGFYNQNAPGADRYSINLKLSKREDSVDGTDFIEILKVASGVISTTVERTAYADVIKELAQRTYDESGDYTTSHFPIEIKDAGENYTIKINPGKAYVRGYENELLVPIEVSAPKARETRTINADHIQVEFGPYFEIENVNDIEGVFDILHKEKISFITNVDGSGIPNYGGTLAEQTIVGPTDRRITHLTKFGNMYRIYVDSDFGLDVIAPATYIVSQTNPDIFVKLYRPTGESVQKGTFRPWIYQLQRMTSSVTAGQTNYSTQKDFVVTINGSSETINSAYANMHWERIIYIYDKTLGTIIPEFGTVSSGVVWQADYTGNENVQISILNQSDSTSNTTLHSHDLAIMSDMYISNANWKNISYTTFTEDVTLTANNELILNPGVTEIVSITAPDLSDATEDFWFFEGEYDTELKDAYVQWSHPTNDPAPGATYSVTFKAYTYGASTNASMFTVNSYTDAGINYGDIGAYVGYSEPTNYRLADTLDFRCTSGNFLSGNYLPLPSSNITVSYSYYLPRADRLTISTDGEFSIKQGFSSEGALLPTELPSEMTLYNFYIPPYTYDVKNISKTYVDNKNYKMSDLRDMDERISSLEYYTSLNLLEQDTASMQVLDENGLDRYKNGMLVDSFTDHGVGDISNKEYFMSVYPEAGIATTPFTMKGFDFEVGDTTGMQNNGRTLTLAYDIVEGWISQSFASSILNLNPFAKLSWIGFLEISPNSDTWFEETYAPSVIVQNDNNNNVLAQVEAFGTQTRWGSWATTWTGWSDTGGKKDFVAGSTETKWRGRTIGGYAGRVDVNQIDGHVAGNGHTNIKGFTLDKIWNQGWMATNTWVGNGATIFRRPSKMFKLWKDTVTKNATWKQDQTRTSTSVRTGTKTWKETKDIRTTIGDKQIDASSINWMRSVDITLTADKMRPETQLHFVFDGINVDAYCRPADGEYGDAVRTDSAGRVRDAIFTIPSEKEGIRFNTGRRTLQVQDAYDETMTTQTSAVFTSAGTLNTRQRTILSTLESVTKSETVNGSKNGTEGKTIQRGGGTTTSSTSKTIREYYDPVAESFMVSNQEGGVFIDSIDLYFYSKDTGEVPVRCEIREMMNGYPMFDALPMASTFVYPDDVYTSDNGTANTRFTFADPIYLMNGTEYCFVVISDSLEYNVWISELGDRDRATGTYISTQPFLGSMFTSQNNSTWTPEQTKDLKFQLNKCKFETNSVATVQYNMKSFEGIHSATGFTPNFQPMKLSGTDVNYSMVVNSDIQNIMANIEDGVDEAFESVTSLDGSQTIASGYAYTPLSIISELSTTNENISPVFNKERLSIITRNNVVHDGATEGHNSAGVYVSRMVQLSNPAEDLNMWLSIQENPETYVKVFYDTGETIPRYIDIDFNSNVETMGYYSVNDFEQEYAFVYNTSPEDQITAGSPTQSSWNGTVSAYDSSLYIDGDNDPENLTRMHVVDISNMKSVSQGSWVSKYDLNGIGKDTGNLANYALGEMWFGTAGNNLDKKVYRKVTLQDNSVGKEEVPILQISSLVDAEHVDFVNGLSVIEEPAITWREMMDTGASSSNSNINTDMEFLEHTFKPLKKITKEFSSFRIKIEMYTTNAVFMPAIRELRVLAVT